MTDQKTARWTTLRAGDRVRIATDDGQSLFVDLVAVNARPGFPTLIIDEHGDTYTSDGGFDVRVLRRLLTAPIAELDLPLGVSLAMIWDEVGTTEPVFELTDGKRTYRAIFEWDAQTLNAEVTRWYPDGTFELGRYVVTQNGLIPTAGDINATGADTDIIRKTAFWLYDQD